MIQPLSFITVLTFIALLVSCGPQSSDAALSGEDAVPGASKSGLAKGDEPSADEQLAALLANFEREVWQKPNMVISRMGDLSDKTVADIGAGYGYFTFRMAQAANKVIAIDIDSAALQVIDEKKKFLDAEIRDRIETRLCTPADPNLLEGESDLAVFVNTYIYLADRTAYLEKLKRGISPGGRLLIIDFKKKNLPFGPPAEYKLGLSEVEQELIAAGWEQIQSDDRSLDYQYIVTAVNGRRQ